MDYSYRLRERGHTPADHERRISDIEGRTDTLEGNVSELRHKVMRGLILAGLTSGAAASHLAPESIASKILAVARIMSGTP